MTKLHSRATVSIAALAALSMTVTPALARDGGDWGRYRHHRHGDGGAVLAGLLIVGGAAAIASAVSKSSAEAQPEEAYSYPGGPDDSDAEDGAYEGDSQEPDDGEAIEAPRERSDDPSEGDNDTAPDTGYSNGAGAQVGFDDAVNRCADEIEQGDNRIGAIDNVRHMGGRYTVEGHMETGRGFACSVDEEGQVRSVDINDHAMI